MVILRDLRPEALCPDEAQKTQNPKQSTSITAVLADTVSPI